ncbi:DUF500-domain-containing protein [Teratosphaeria nubilosa]|uniref:DUF500-domain-containing protein n=1 Tax=Teratosphaeria nubilosa TaxID=161662 RepID=A0A6G1KYI3_9PEZI|nr:DUF500-domain-containing protein [Teratosphaeria nubilosa]
MSQSSWWERVKGGSKKGFDQTWKAMDKLGAPVNKLSNKLGSEAFWPTTLDKESDKAARILKSFCKDGFYAEEERQAIDGPKQKQKVVKKIPEKVIKNAKGLAIFTTMRTGLWMSGAGGSGILVARLPDGSWSPPSGILLHTAGLGFMVGVDIYDCVVVINSEKALEAFTKIRCTLGGEISVAAGPVGAGGVLETELHKRQAPIFTYMKSRGFYAGVQIDGTIILERTDENERFYGERIPVADILAGKVRHPPYEIKQLMETIRAAQGDSNVDESILPDEPPPGDYVMDEGHVFGVPDKEDPDPYGVLALEKEGLSLKEAGTNKRASWEEFSFNPSPTSPVHAVYKRNSQEREGDRRSTMSRRSSWRASAAGSTGHEPKTPSSLRNSMDHSSDQKRSSKSTMVDSSTQADGVSDSPTSPDRSSLVSRRSSRESHSRGIRMQEVPENEVLETPVSEKDEDRKEPESVSTANGHLTPPRTPPVDNHQDDADANDRDDEDEDEDAVDVAHFEEPVVHSVQTFQTAQKAQPASPRAISKARIVTVPKRLPPKLPPRNPNRSGPVLVGGSPSSPPLVDQSHHVATADEEATLAALNKNEEIEQVKQKLDDVKLEDEDDDLPMSDGWAQAEKTRKRQSADSSHVPGGFD